MSAIEDDIAAELTSRIDAQTTVECPSSIEWEPGEEFKCEAKSKGASAVVTVSMQNDDGEYFWQTG